VSVATPRMPRSPVSNVDSALNRGKLNVLTVVAIVMAAAAPLTVIAGGATTGWAVTGVLGIPIAYLAVAAILGLFSVGYTQMSRHIVNAGAFYSYVAHGLGRIPGVAASGVALLAYNAMQIGLYGGFGAVLSGFLKTRYDLNITWWACAFGAWAVIAVLGVLRIDLNGKILAGLLAAEVLIAVVFAAVQVAHPANGTVTFDTLAPSNLWATGIGAALVTAVAGFVGFEATAVYSEETKNPAINIPRATYLALAIIGVLYAFCSWAMSVAAGPGAIVEASKTNSTELTFVLVNPYLGQVWLDAGHFLFTTSLFAALLAFHNTAARYAFALGREKVLPAWMGRTNRHNSAPVWGSLTQTLLAAAVLALYTVTDLDPIIYLFFWITVLGGLGVLILMTATSAAVLVYFARSTDPVIAGISRWRRQIAPTLATVTLLAVLVITLKEFEVLLGVKPEDPWRWILPGLFLAAALIGAVWAAVLKATNPQVYAGIGRGANAVLTPTPPTTAAAHAATSGDLG
jgi:amino acid transporter